MNKLTLTLNRHALSHVLVAVAMSFVNLVGALLALAALGGMEPWSRTQFVGLFGLIELGMGLAYLFAPNAWRLPVAEAETSGRTAVRLAASTLLIPHWIAAAKAGSGAAMVVYAGVVEGISAETLTVPLAAVLIGATFLALSVAVARLGVARPEIDVWFITIRRAGGKEKALPGLSAGGVSMQVLSNFGVFPAVALLSPSALYGPQLAASPEVIGWLAAAAGIAVAGVWLAWRGRIAWRAPREQQREAEAELSAEAPRAG